nr:Inner membrane amino-acid ABC transporter permease protein YecS [Candidatus Pantoea persica]
MPLITINQVQKYYGDNHMLKGVDLDIEMGEVISIIGRSGSGKRTLLRCMSGLEGYQEGRASSWAAWCSRTSIFFPI